jgi:hypothetical protein
MVLEYLSLLLPGFLGIYLQLSAEATRVPVVVAWKIRKIASLSPSRLFIDVHLNMAGSSGRSPAEIGGSNPTGGPRE